MKRQRVVTTHRPHVDSYPPLKAWLEKHHGQCRSRYPVYSMTMHSTDPHAYIEVWAVRVAAESHEVVLRLGEVGWSIYTTIQSTDADMCLADAGRRVQDAHVFMAHLKTRAASERELKLLVLEQQAVRLEQELKVVREKLVEKARRPRHRGTPR